MSYVPVTVEQHCRTSPQRAFDVIAPIPLSLIFHRSGLLPGVDHVENQTGEWDRVGMTRNPILTDGSRADEEITEYTSPHSFAYVLTGFTTPALRLLVEHVRGEWTFTPEDGECLVRWTYSVHPKHALLVRVLLAPIWRRYMRGSLALAIAIAERPE